MSSPYHHILASQLQECFTVDQLTKLATDASFADAFSVFLSQVSRAYQSVDTHYEVARAIAKTARVSEERLERYGCIVHYAQDST